MKTDPRPLNINYGVHFSNFQNLRNTNTNMPFNQRADSSAPASRKRKAEDAAACSDASCIEFHEKKKRQAQANYHQKMEEVQNSKDICVAEMARVQADPEGNKVIVRVRDAMDRERADSEEMVSTPKVSVPPQIDFDAGGSAPCSDASCIEFYKGKTRRTWGNQYAQINSLRGEKDSCGALMAAFKKDPQGRRVMRRVLGPSVYAASETSTSSPEGKATHSELEDVKAQIEALEAQVKALKAQCQALEDKATGPDSEDEGSDS